MTVTAPDGVCYDPYDVQINAALLEEILKRFPEWEVDLSAPSCLRRPPCVVGRQCRRFSVEPNTNQEMR